MASGFDCLLDYFSVIAKFHGKDEAASLSCTSTEFCPLQLNVLIVLHFLERAANQAHV